MEATVDAHVARLVGLLETKYLSTPDAYRPVDLALKTQFFTLDVISDLAFGRPFGYLDTDGDVFDYIRTTTSLIPALTVLSNVPWLARVLHSRVFRSALPKATDKMGFGALIGFVPFFFCLFVSPCPVAELTQMMSDPTDVRPNYGCS